MKSHIFSFSRLRRHTLAARLTVLTVAIIIFSLVIANSISDEALYISAAAGESERVVIIDAGHGGEDSGAIGANGVYEKDLNLALAMKIGEMLTEKGFVVIYTRTDDRLLYGEAGNIVGMKKIYDLKNRCLVSVDHPDAIFVSIHMKSFAEAKYSGLQVYYSTKNPDSAVLAEKIQSSVKKTIQPNNNRKTKLGRDLYLMENIENVAVLIECGFLSNPEECEKLSQKEYQKELSFSIVCGIIEYIEKSES